MKKLLLIYFMAILGMNCVAQVATKDPDPIKYIKNCVLHGIPMMSYHDLDNFLLTLYGNESFCNEIGKEIVDSAKAHGIDCKYTYRGNMLDFKLCKDSLTMTYHVWFKIEESEGPLSICYYFGKWRSTSDKWMTHNMISQTKSQPDSRPIVELHSKIVAGMMKMDLWIPHMITTSLSYNLQYCDGCLEDFKNSILSKNLSLKVLNNSLSVSNAYRSYLIINNKNYEPTFEVTPMWSSK